MRLRTAALAAGFGLLALVTVASGVQPVAASPHAHAPAPAPGAGAGAGAAHGPAGVVAHSPADVTVAGREPTCGDTSAIRFPITTRIVGGPDSYRPGDAFREWSVELTNTTRQPCRNIHPVIVLTDRGRTLKPAQVRLEFSSGAGLRPGHPVVVEQTDQDEIVGVLDDDADRSFAGFTVPAGRTVRVPVRLAFTADTALEEVTAHAAIVQRKGDDGDWVGESGAYRFALVAAGEPFSPPEIDEELATTGRRGVLPLAGAAVGAVLLGAGAVVMARRPRRDRPRD
ncbi:hypothetical protein [Streptomyces sp. NPDC047928]|uniref:hypothetical protein n=1 Tax=unclassified Streptomyces TaxID=2593676 RepID=UPI00371DE42C